MSVTNQVTIWCDRCHNWEQATTTASKLRKELKAQGWSSITRYRTSDYCPICTKLVAKEEKEAAKKYAKLLEQRLKEYK